jgi:hypothetical protein
MSETHRARNTFFYALAVYVVVVWLAARWSKPVVPPWGELRQPPAQCDPYNGLVFELWLKAPALFDLLGLSFAILRHVIEVISVLNPFAGSGCG